MKKFTLFSLIFGMGFLSFSHAQQLSIQQFSPQQKTIKMHQESHLSNDTLWVNDTTLVYHAQDNDWMLSHRELVLSRNDLGKPVTSLWQFYNVNQESWLNSSFDSLVYYNKNIFKEKFSYLWDTTTGDWVLNGHTSKTEDGRTLEEGGLTWSPEKQKYSYGYKGVYTYYSDKQLQSFVNQTMDTLTGTWVPMSKTAYYYDQNGEDSLQLVFSWDIISSDWNTTYKTVYQPEQGSNRTTETTFKWNNEQQEWLPIAQTERYQHSTITDSTVTANWKENHQMWLNNTKVIYQYDPSGNKTDVIYQTYYPGEKKWYNVRRFYSIYDEENRVTEYGEKLWDLTAKRWNDHEQYLSVYDNGQLKLFEYSVMPFDTLAFKVMYRMEYSYDNRNNVAYVLGANLNENDELVYTSKVVYLWSPFTTPNAVAETSNNLLAIYPNPTNGLIHFVNGNKTNQPIRIQLLDVQGRPLFTKEMQHNTGSIDLSGNPAGIYFLRISSNGKTSVKQVVIK